MSIPFTGTFRRRFAAAAAGIIVAAFADAAMAQWAPPYGGAYPGEIERSLEAQGYVLRAPLMRRPGVYLADVSAGPAGHQRLIIDARSGQVLERFPSPGREWGPSFAARDEPFGEPQAGGVRPPLAPDFYGAPSAAPQAQGSAYGGSGNGGLSASTGSHGEGAGSPAAKPKPRTASNVAKNPPLPPPAPREAMSQSDPTSDTRPAAAPVATPVPAPVTEGGDKSKVSIVPSAAFE
jgi:hypothetical protein